MNSVKKFARSVIHFLFFNDPLLWFGSRLYGYFQRTSNLYYEKTIKRRFNIHPSVRWADGTTIYGSGSITIGEQTYFGNNCYVVSYPEQAKIVIGKYCAIAHNVHIRTSNYPRVPEFKDAFNMPSEWADITIGDYCWIGSHVYINAGVIIGENSVIGANSVVTHDVEPNSVVGGVPARLIHKKSVYQSK